MKATTLQRYKAERVLKKAQKRAVKALVAKGVDPKEAKRMVKETMRKFKEKEQTVELNVE